MTRKAALSFSVSLAISILLIWWLLRQIDSEALNRTFRALHVPALLAFFGISFTGAVLRAWRYKWLLAPDPIGWKPVLLVTFIRNLFVDLLPARIGSLSYVYVLNRRLGFSFQAAASTFVVAVVLDFLTLSPFLIVSLLVVGLGNTAVSSPALLLMALVFLACTALLYLLLIPFFQRIMDGLGLLLRLLRCGEKSWALLLRKRGEETISALAFLRNRRIFWPLFGLSLLVRLAKYVSLYVLLFSLMHSQGFSLSPLSFAQTILGITGAELTSLLPVKGLAGFGTWESAWALSFRLMRFDPQLAVLSGIGVHLFTNAWEYGLGILSLLLIFSPWVRHLRPGRPAGLHPPAHPGGDRESHSH